jgi:hypothetical protein
VKLLSSPFQSARDRIDTSYSLDIVKAVSPLETLWFEGSFSILEVLFLATFFLSAAVSIAEAANSVTFTSFPFEVDMFCCFFISTVRFGRLIS